MRPIAELSLRVKTRLALLGVLALFMVFGGVALDRMNALHQAATALGETALPDARLIGDIDILASSYRAAEAEALLAGLPSRVRLDDVRGRLDGRLAELAVLDLPTEAAVAARSTVLTLWPRYATDSAAMLALAASGQMAEATEAFRATGEAFEALGAALHVLLAAGEDAHAEAQRRIQRAADQTRWLTLTVGTGLLIIGLAMVLLFEASLVATAQRLLAAMRQVAAGNTQAPVPHTDRDDEFGDLARAVRAFADGLDGQLRREEELRAQAGTDELTGVANRRAFLERADDEINRSLRYDHTLSLLMLDIDHFKQVNDTYGHAAGDAALVRMVEACLPSLREHDLLARLGGEEFVVLLPHTDSASALLVAERLRAAVERAGVETPAGLFHITISIGSATLPEGDHPDGAAESLSMLLERADKALYRAKHGGRNQVVCSVLPAA